MEVHSGPDARRVTACGVTAEGNNSAPRTQSAFTAFPSRVSLDLDHDEHLLRLEPEQKGFRAASVETNGATGHTEQRGEDQQAHPTIIGPEREAGDERNAEAEDGAEHGVGEDDGIRLGVHAVCHCGDNVRVVLGHVGSAPRGSRNDAARSGALVAWAHHDTITGHARNALQALFLVQCDAGSVGDIIELETVVERRLRAIVALAASRYELTSAGRAALALGWDIERTHDAPTLLRGVDYIPGGVYDDDRED